ncbi:MAG: hypothetical protein AB8G23_15480 [Myxococcota bacterium]
MAAASETTEAPESANLSGSSDDASEALAKAFSAPIAEKDQANLSLVILRDVAIVSVLLSVFAAAETWAQVSGLAFAALLSVVNGFLVGTATGALLHEWGHFAGARLGGGHAPLKPIGGFLPLFDFDYKNNDAKSFDWMSIGGNVAHFSVVALFFFALPMTSPGAAALVGGAFGFAVFSSLVEFPVIRKARSGLTGIEALATIPRDFVSRYFPWAVGAGIVAFLAL